MIAQRQNILNDVTNVTGQAFLGLTFGCARCHDHKYDPILQVDYFRMQAFFANTIPADDAPIGTAEELARHERQHGEWDTATATLRREMEKIEAPVREQMVGEQMLVFPKDVQAVLKKSPDERTPREKVLADLAGKQFAFDDKTVSGKMGKDADKRWTELPRRWTKKPVPRQV